MSIFSKTFLFTFSLNFNQADWWLVGIFAAFLVLAVLARILQFFTRQHAIKSHFFHRLFVGLISSGLVGAIWVALRRFAVPVFGYRFSAMLILLASLVWLGFILYYFFRRFFGELEQFEQQQVKERYLKPRS